MDHVVLVTRNRTFDTLGSASHARAFAGRLVRENDAQHRHDLGNARPIRQGRELSIVVAISGANTAERIRIAVTTAETIATGDLRKA